MDEEQSFSRIYARLLQCLDPDPVRSGETLRAIRRALSDSGSDPGKSPRSSRNLEDPMV